MADLRQFCSCIKMAALRQYMTIPKETEETEPNANSEKAIRRIFECPKSVPNLGELSPSQPKFVFGPHYRATESEWSAKRKEDAWQKLIEKEGGEEHEIPESYISAMRRIEKKARATYAEEALKDLTRSDFRKMMINDGCFFLQLALSILGASKQLGYPDDHLLFQKKQNKKTLLAWIKSMFLVGNQIPLVVLNELMMQKFFQEVIKAMKWERPSDMLSKQILFDLLVIPALEKPSSKLLNKLARKTFLPDQEKPSDLLHGLQLFLLGPRDSRIDSTENEREDELEDGDLEAGIQLNGIYPKTKDDENKNRFPKTKDNENMDEVKKELCASVLRSKGILIRKSRTAGSRGISFTNWIICGRLALPTLKVNHDTKMLFTNLKYYEIAQQQMEIRSYLRFLSNLISAYEDINVLASKGIIDASTSDEKEKFLEMLRTLADKETTPYHRKVLGRVKDYSVFPWERFKYVGIIAFLLTIAQTVFSVLSYAVGLK